MPKGRIHNLPADASVSLTRDGQTVTLGAPVDPGGRTVTIETDRTNAKNISPAGFMFKAVADGFDVADQRELRFKWNFDDPEAITLTALRAERFDRFGWRDSNTAYTNYATHVFDPSRAAYDGAGSYSYTITCTATDKDGNSATGTKTITVHNPDVEYAGALTKLVAPDNNFAGAEFWSGAEQYTSFDDAYAATTGAGGRILLKRGFTYNNSNNRQKNRPKLQVNSWGSGAYPVFDVAYGDGFAFNSDMPDVQIAHVDFEGDWNELTESCPSGNITTNPFTWDTSTQECFHTVHNIRCRTINNLALLSSGKPFDTHRRHIYVSNFAVDGYRNCGILCGTTWRFGVQGVSFRRDPLAAQGGRGDKNGNAHTTVRCTGPLADSWNVFDGFDAFSCSGWPTTSSNESFAQIGGASTIPAPQSCLRWNPGSAKTGESYPALLRLSRFVAEGGNGVLIGTVSYNPETTYGDMHLDKGVVICGSTAANGIGFGHKGLWISNVLGVVPKMKFARSKDYSPIINGAGTAAHRSRVWGCTALAWIDPVDDLHSEAGTPVDLKAFSTSTSNEVVTGNLYHAPNMLTPIDRSADLDLSERLFAPSWPGMRFYFWSKSSGVWAKVSQTLYVNTDYAALDTFDQGGGSQASVCLPVPVGTGARANGAAVPVDDMFGNLRPIGAAHLGAIEPTSA